MTHPVWLLMLALASGQVHTSDHWYPTKARCERGARFFNREIINGGAWVSGERVRRVFCQVQTVTLERADP